MVVVKEIELNFEDTELETLYIHQTEKGRAYKLVPPVDVSGLSCRVEMVKPDNTFIIQDLETSAEGIIFEVPEQAAALVGVGWYNLSFRDGDTVIYTCYGRYQIDDHLISDSMVESVAEVNGYSFPDDFATKGDIAGAVIDDDIYSDKLTWSSEKIANYVNDEVLIQVDNIYRKLDTITTYSTDEHAVGTWIDGSTIYEKTIYLQSALLNSSSSASFEIQYNIGRLIRYSGSVYDNNDQRYYAIPYCRNNSNENIEFQLHVLQNHTLTPIIFTRQPQTYNLSDLYLTIVYIKYQED